MSLNSTPVPPGSAAAFAVWKKSVDTRLKALETASNKQQQIFGDAGSPQVTLGWLSGSRTADFGIKIVDSSGNTKFYANETGLLVPLP